MLYRILGNVDGALIITVHNHCVLTKTIVSKELLHPQELSTTTSNCNVFDFSSENRDEILLHAHPRNKISPYIKGSFLCTFSIINTSCPINIGIAG